MKHLRQLTCITACLAAAALGAGCGAIKPPAQVEALPVKKVRPATGALKIMTGMSGTQTTYYKGHDKLPPFSKNVQVDVLAFRSLKDDPADQTLEARKNDALVEQCPEGRPNLDFIQEINVGVRKPTEKDTEAVVVGTYKQTQKGLCGVHLTPTYFNMHDYVEDYVFVIQVTGTLPLQPVSISGFYSAQDYEAL